MEKRPAVSTDRLTTSSPKREFWIESVSESWGEEVTVDSFTVTPDQQVVTNDQEVAKTRARNRKFLLPYLDFKVMLDRYINNMYGFYLIVFRHNFCVWE